MPNLLENTAAQNAVTSNQGINKMPKLDAKSHFFLEDETYIQLPTQAFGVLSDNEFRTTALVSVSEKKVISICPGQVFLQPSNETGKVNLVLKPYKQPITGLSVKYFIYRGLPKDQFLDSAGKVVATGSGLITHIQNEFNNFYRQDASLSPPPDLLGKYIGYPDPAAPAGEAQEPGDLIDSYFYKISQTFADETGDIANPKRAFEMPMIPAGTHLATVTGIIGLDIVLNDGDYYIENDPNPFRFDLAFARAPFNVINVAAITNAYQNKLMRETITRFIDPAAYYGLHANGGKIYKFGVTQAIETPEAIYALITPFVTKNNIYLYVQGNRQRSYNFYNIYAVSDTNPNNMKLGTTEDDVAETTFETDNWPVKIVSTAPASGSTQQTMALQFTTDKSTNTSLYGSMANIITANNEGFVDAKDLIQQPDADGAVSDFTQTIVLASPVANNLNIASIVQLIYLGRNIMLSRPGVDDGDPATPSPDPILFTAKYMDDVFYLTDAISFLQAEKIYHVHSYKPTLINQQEIDKNRSKVVSFTQRTQNTIAISETENITLFTYLSVAESEQSRHSSISTNTSANKEATGFGVQEVVDLYTLPNLPNNEFVEIKTFTDSTNVINGFLLKTNDNSMPSTLVLGISESEFIILKGLIINVNNSKLYFRNILRTEEDFFLSIKNVKYKVYTIEVISENQQGILEVFSPTIEIKVFSIDGLVFFSQIYSDYILSNNNIDISNQSENIISNE